jgi:hypothetical protein
MVAASHTSQVALFKRMYPKGVINQMLKKSIGLSDCKKNTKFGGEGKHINIQTSGTGGGSADFATAFANQNPTTQKRFFIQHKTEYQIASVTGQAIATSLDDAMAVARVLKVEMDGALRKFNLQLSGRFFGNAGGARGQISAGSAVGTATITLANRLDHVHFEVGDWVQTAPDNGTGVAPLGVNGGGAQLQIVSKDPILGTLTANAAWNTIAGTLINHFIFRAGDYSKAMSGLNGWVPSVAPVAGENFQGMDRSVGDVARQAGIRYNGAGAAKEDTFLNATAEASALGSFLPRGYVNPLDYNDIVKELGSKRIVDAKAKDTGFGFKGIEVYTAGGVLEIIADVFQPRGTAKLVDPDDITLHTAGDCPNPLNWGGANSTQVPINSDGLQFRLGCYGEFGYEMNNVPVHVTF